VLRGVAYNGDGLANGSMGIDAGDYDNDGDIDLWVTNFSLEANCILQNDGDGYFEDVPFDTGLADPSFYALGFGTRFIDFDNDGWLDLHLATTKFTQLTAEAGPEGMHDPYTDFLFHNEGNGNFIDVTPTSWQRNGKAAMGSAYADFDQDGFVDLLLTNWNDGPQLYRNTALWGAENRSLWIRLQGDGRRVNRDAAGARVYLQRADGLTLMREVKLGSSLGAGNDPALHFGLGRSRVVGLTVRWPTGMVQQVQPPAPEIGMLVIEYPETAE